MTFYGHMLPHRVDLEPVDDLDDKGAPQYGTKQTDVPAYVERNVEIDMGDDGAESVIGDRVTLAEKVDKSDRIHLPDGDVMEVAETRTMPSTDGRTTLNEAVG